MSELETIQSGGDPGGAAPQTAGSQTFQEMLDETFKSIHTGNIVKGTVVRVTASEVIVDLGFKSDGIISRAEFSDDQGADLTTLTKPGDVLEVSVLRVNDGEGNVLVSKKKVDSQLNFKLLEQAFNDGTPVTAKVTDVVKGGLIANFQGCRIFVPSSQISNRFVQNLETFKGGEFDFNILEYDRTRRRIVAGRRELAEAEAKKRRAELFASLEAGQRVEGTVSRVVDFGAFVDLGGVDGLIHVSELAWKRVRKASDILAVGDAVNPIVISIDPEKNKISLSLRDSESNPWNGLAEKYPAGEIVEGTVVRLAPFGAFVNLEEGVDGLVHISQIADRRVEKTEDELSPGQVIHVKIVDVDIANHKISLSKRDADAILNPPAPEEGDTPPEDSIGNGAADQIGQTD